MSARPLPFRGAHPEADVLAAWLEGRLPRPARDTVQHHLAHCVICREWAWLTAQARAAHDGAASPVPRRFALAAWSTAAAVCLATAAGGYVWWQPLPQPLPRPLAIAASVLQNAAVLQPASRIPNAVVPAPVSTPPAASASLATLPPTLSAVTSPAAESANAGAAPVPARFVPVTTGFADQPAHPVVAENAVFRGGSLSGPRPAFATLAARMTPPLMSSPADSGVPTVADLEREAGSRYAVARTQRSGVYGYAGGDSGLDDGSLAPPFTNPALAGAMAGVAAGSQLAAQAGSAVGWVATRGDSILHKVSVDLLSDGSSDAAVQARTIAGAGDRLWAAGLSDQIWTSPDGDHWQKVELPGGAAAPSAILTINFSDSRRGVITAADGRAWNTTDAGQHWKLASAH